MEMPTDGELLCINIYPDGKVSINLDLNCKQVATAIPVPPHGRLGDLDALQADGWTMQRTFQSSPVEMTWETKSPLDFPIVIPASEKE